MIRVKDGFGKLIGTTAAGSAGRVLLSNGGDSEFLRSKTYINNTGEVDYYKKITITNSSTEGFVIWIHSRLQHYLLNSGANAMSTSMNVFWELGTNYNNSTTSRVINIKAVATASSAKVVLYALVKAYTYILIVSPGEINIEDSTKEDYDAITSSTSGWITCKTANWSDTNNTAGSTNNASKMYLIGATTQGSSTQTYSNNKVYATDGVLYVDSLRIGYDSTRNYIAFNGTTGDGTGSYNHTYVGENYTGASELSELVLFKGNDPSNGSGPDRIRHIAGRHLFQVYTSALSGSFETICTSTVPVNCLALNATDITTYNPILPSTTNALDLGSSTFKWANVYATNFNGNATTATTATTIKQIVSSSNANYPLLLAPSGQTTTNNSGGTYFDSEVTLNPSTNILDKAKVYESLLEWGGYNVAGDVSPIDAAMSSEFAQNRLAFLNPDLITIEFTRDNGANWYTYPKTYTDAGIGDAVTTGYKVITNDQKQRLVTDGLYHTLWLGSRRGNQTASDKLRITIHGDGIGLFIKCKKILFNYCQAYGNGSYCLVEAAMANTPDTFNIVKLYNILGWTNWNSIPYVGNLGEWSNNNRSGYTRKLRLTFGVTGVTENYPTDIYINKLRIFGTDSYAGGNSLTLTGHLYSFNVNKHATFPSNLTANGSLVANGITSLGALTVNQTLTVKGSTTLTGPLTGPLTINSNVANSVLDAFCKNGSYTYLRFGKSTGTDNCGELMFNYVNDQSTDRYLQLGFFGNYTSRLKGYTNGTWTINDSVIFTAYNYNNYVPKLDGTGAWGTWDITSSKATSLISTDSRSIEDTPTTYNKGLYAAFKNNGVNAMSDGYSYYGLLHFRPYGSNTDFSGGYPYLLAFTENQHIWYRKAKNATEWNTWKLLAFLSDLSSYATTTYVDTAIANAQLDGSNVTIPVVDVKVKNSSSSSAVTVINANKEAIIDLSTYAKLADLPKSLPLTPILTYDAIFPIGAYAYENANGDASTNGFVFSNSSVAFGWGKSNCLVVLAAQAGKSTPTIFVKQYYLSWGDWHLLVHSGNVNDYAPKWDGTNAKGTWNISILGKASGITGYTFKTLSAKSHSGWTNNTTDDKIIPTMSMLAYWNGAVGSNGSSNLTYCTKGAFGDAAVKGVTTSVTNGDTNLVTSGGVYSYINTISEAYLPLAGGTLTGNLNFNSLIPITWTGGTYQLRINTIDDGITGTDVFQFLQSSDSGTNWKTLLSIRDEGTINLTGGDIPNLSAYWLSPTIMQSDNIAQTIWIGTGSPMSYSLISGNNKLTIFDQTITVGTNNKLFINFEIPSLVLGLRGGYDTASADEWSILLTPTYYIYLNGTLYKTISEPGYVVETNTNNNVSVRIEIKISYPQLSTGDVFLVLANGPYYSSLNNLAIQLTGVIYVNYEECANSNVYNLAVSIVNKEGFLICDTAKTNITYSNSDMFFIKRGSKCFKITNDGVLLSSDEGISWKLL